jgi:hypothetical protein
MRLFDVHLIDKSFGYFEVTKFTDKLIRWFLGIYFIQFILIEVEVKGTN